MTEIPEHLRKRAEEARKKAETGNTSAGAANSENIPDHLLQPPIGVPEHLQPAARRKIPEHLLQRSRTAKNKASGGSQPGNQATPPSSSAADANRGAADSFVVESVLGSDLNPDAIKRLTAARNSGALTVSLALESEAYIERQQRVNGDFISSVQNGLRKAVLTPPKALSRPSANILNDTDRIGYLYGIESKFRITTRDHELSEIGDVIEPEIRGLRSAVIWLRQDAGDELEISRRSNGEARFVQRSTYVPHVIMGHKHDDERERTEALLLPVINTGGRTVDLGGNTFYGSVDVEPLNRIKRVEMTTGQYLQLELMQDTLINEGEISSEDARRMKDPNTDDFIITHEVPSGIRAHASAGLFLPVRKAPMTMDELDDQEFDVRMLGTMDNDLTPHDFTDYNVQADLHATSLRLGRDENFRLAQARLLQDTLQDPAVRHIGSIE